MKSIARVSAVAAILLMVTSPVRADLLGSLVTGQLQVNGVGPNYFDPANGFVPSGYLNQAGPTVTISSSQTEFGFFGGINTITADFGASTLALTINAPTGNVLPIKFVFTDSAFSGLTLTKSNDSVPGGLTATLVGTVLTINSSSINTAGLYNGTFTLTSGTASVPEPSQLALAGLGGLFAAGAAIRRRLKAAA